MPRPFKLQQFEVYHHRSPQAVGTDAILLGSYPKERNYHSILEVGPGCGIITLMLAQKYPNALIKAIELNPAATKEAQGNVLASPFADRISIFEGDYLKWTKGSYDLIISNPPFFLDGIFSPEPTRQQARHIHAEKLEAWLSKMQGELNTSGEIVLILSPESKERLVKHGAEIGLFLREEYIIHHQKGKKAKRYILCWTNTSVKTGTAKHLYLYQEDGKTRTREFSRWTADYLLS